MNIVGTALDRVRQETARNPDTLLKGQCTNISFEGTQPGLQHSDSGSEWMGVTQGELGLYGFGERAGGAVSFIQC